MSVARSNASIRRGAMPWRKGLRCIVSGMGKSNGLRVLDGARQLGEDILKVVDTFPSHDPAGLRSQLASAARSVSANIAEGCGRGAVKDRLHFLHIARASLEEVQNDLKICSALRWLERETFLRLWNRALAVGRMLAALIARLERELPATGLRPR